MLSNIWKSIKITQPSKLNIEKKNGVCVLTVYLSQFRYSHTRPAFKIVFDYFIISRQKRL